MQPATRIHHLKRNAELAEANQWSLIMIQSIRWPRSVFYCLLLSDLLLVALYWAGTIFTHPEYQSFTDLDGEANLASWFSSSQILLIAILGWLLVYSSEKTGAPSRLFLAFFATGAMLWSMDETSQMHERITQCTGARYVDWLPQFMTSHKAIAVTLAAVALVIASKILKEVISLWRESRRVCLIAISGFTLCFLGGIVIETLGYRFVAVDSGLMHMVQVSVEEFFEMAGASLILYSLSLLLARREYRRQTVIQQFG